MSNREMIREKTFSISCVMEQMPNERLTWVIHAPDLSRVGGYIDSVGKDFSLFQFMKENPSFLTENVNQLFTEILEEININEKEEKMTMTKNEILEKAKTVLEEKKRRGDEKRREILYIETCLSAKICPECGRDLRSWKIVDMIFEYYCDACGQSGHCISDKLWVVVNKWNPFYGVKK